MPSNFLCTLGDDDYSPSLHDACRRGNIELLEECLDNRSGHIFELLASYMGVGPGQRREPSLAAVPRGGSM